MDDSLATARIRENLDWGKLVRGGDAPESERLEVRAERESLRFEHRGEFEGPPADRNRFVALAYRAVLGRDPSQQEILHHARLLRFLPFFYTRFRFLSRLQGCWEAVERRTRERRRHDAEVLMRLKLLELHLEQNRDQIKALFSAVTELGDEIMADLRESPAPRGGPDGAAAPARDRRHPQESPPCAS